MDAPCISAKSGLNVEEVLEKIVTDLPAPDGDVNSKTKCLIFDSYYDNYKGAVAYVRVIDGNVKVGDEILLMLFLLVHFLKLLYHLHVYLINFLYLLLYNLLLLLLDICWHV